MDFFGFFKKKAKLDRSEQHTNYRSFSESAFDDLPESEIDSLQNLRNKFEKEFERLSEEESKELANDTREIISFAQSRLQEWTGYRSTSLQVSLGMFAFSVAGLAIISDPSKIPLYVYPIAVPFLLVLFVWSLYIFITVARQVSFWYPFIDVANTWRWFYLYCVPSKLPFKTNLKQHEKAASRQLYLEGLLKYAKRTMELSGRKQLQQNIEQLYLLLTYEGYLDQFAMDINKKLARGILFGVCISVGCGLIAWFFGLFGM